MSNENLLQWDIYPSQLQNWEKLVLDYKLDPTLKFNSFKGQIMR